MRRENVLGRVLGLGAAKTGMHHWTTQRLTSVALVPLSLWFVVSAVGLTGADYPVFVGWLSEFGNLVLMILFVAVVFHHAQAGVQVVIEDYVSCEATKIASIMLTKFVAMFGAVSCVVAILLVAFRG